MNNKSALELVNDLLESHKRDDLKTVISDVLAEMRSNHIAPLKKAISDVQEELRKVDPTTKLPGTLLDKQMGDMQSNLNPEKGADESNGVVKADPASAAPMLGSEKKRDWKGFMAKALTCSENMKKASFGSSGTKQIGIPNAPPKKKESMMGGFMAPAPTAAAPAAGASMGKSEKLTKPYASDAQRKKFHAMENRGEISSKVVHEFDEASKGKSLPEHVKKAMPGAPALGGTGTGTPSTPTPRQDKGFGAVVVKASEHEQGVHTARTDLNMPGASMAGVKTRIGGQGNAVKSIHRNILSKLKGMPKPNLTRSEEKPENTKDMSASAKTAIMEPSDQPMKVQPHRPGQANKPVKC